MSIDLRQLVVEVITSLGPKEAARKFGVSMQTITNWSKGGTPPIDAAQMVLDEYQGVKEEVTQAVSWEGRKVFFLIPSYNQMTMETHDTMFRNYAKYGPEKIGLLHEKCTLIEDARNILAHRFMQTHGETAIMIDDDMVLPCGSGDVFNGIYNMGLPKPYCDYLFVDRILSHNQPIVGALYFGRHRTGRGQYAEAFESDQENLNAHRLVRPGLKPTKWVATGGMCVQRQVFEKIRAEASKKFPDILPKNDKDPVAYFRRMGYGVGEDVSFCLRAAAVGFTVYVDTALICGHVGPTVYGPNNTQSRS
jgi:hypothetical protein